MGVRHIFPDWVLCHFAQGAQCGTPGCGRRPIEVFCPMIRRKKAMVELVFPCRCSCDRRGHFVIGLHVLLFGFLLANVAFVKAARRSSKSSMIVYPSQSDLVAKLLDDFDGIATHYVDERTIELTEQDRQKLGLSDEDWQQFRRRMGYDDEAD